MHGDYLLYDERVFYDSEGDEDQIYADGSDACYLGRVGGERDSGGDVLGEDNS